MAADAAVYIGWRCGRVSAAETAADDSTTLWGW